MKKLYVIFTLLVAFMSCKTLISCKNEEKSKLLDNSSSTAKGKENVNSDKTTPLLGNSGDIGETKPEAIKTGIYQDEDSLYHLKYILEPGKTYSFNSKGVNKQIVTFRDKSQSITQESYDPISFTVLNVKDGKYTLQVKMGGKKVVIRADGKQSVFDTNGKKPEDPDQAKMWKIYKIISEATFTLNMDIYGNVSEITGMDALYNKAKSSLSGELSGEELNGFMNVLKQNINPEAFKTQFEGSLMKFPAKGLKIGEKWNNDPSKKGKGYNQLVKVDENTTEIRVQGIIPSKSESKVVEGVTYKISLKGSQSGKIILDNKSGWISKANFNLTVTETKSAKKGEESELVVQKTENNTYIN
ncbi:MAG: DUF6263 family protein [Flavobacteriaceae bacterium]|jgi:hypothetical protein|nr:DUF6263 family protein [Flavobacteriaceae bacterium]